MFLILAYRKNISLFCAMKITRCI